MNAYEKWFSILVAISKKKIMAQFIKVRQKDNIELLINTNIIETVFPDATVANCKSILNFSRPAAKKSFNVQESVEDIWKMILE